MDAVEKAKSGHPGMPMGAAPMAYVLWTRFLRHNPRNPRWPNRDRFILSAGHGSMLLYSLLHLTGYDLPLEELKQFRQWGSRTPGHPEYGLTPGVEVTTGPLGSGFATGVGIAMAERYLADRYNRPGFPIIDHYTYAIVSDGDLMEGIASEAASLAGHLRLGKLIYLYDDNQISIEGSTDLAFSEDVAKRFEAYGWHVQRVADGNDIEAIAAAIAAARAEAERPSLIMVRTRIGYGSPNKENSPEAHGAPLGEEEVRRTKAAYGWPEDAQFLVPDEVRAHMGAAVQRGQQWETEWNDLFRRYEEAYPAEAAELKRILSGQLPEGWHERIPTFPAGGSMATRSASGKVLNAIAPVLPELVGGSADLAPSTNTYIQGGGDWVPGDFRGRNIHFGVRENAMGAALNGLSLSGLRPYGGTFLVFSDYMRPTIRLAALMEQPVIYVFTHDSIGVGEDGPTHQPVEHLAALRAIPNLVVFRPADANETAVGWRLALENRKGPFALILTRQNLPVLDPEKARGAERGGYVLAEASSGRPEVILIATGSEVSVALGAREILEKEGIPTRVVSLPSWEIFDRQPKDYRDAVLPPEVTARVAVEAAVPMGWERYVGPRGAVVGLSRFGASAPGKVLFEKFGFTPENVARVAREVLGR
ncbi:MAG: transketolase [Firmicutes bacterium]|nr:transketolase [Bacillota bacterium]